MDDFLYIATSGANEALLAQAVTSSNLANISTTGFRADLVMAQSVYLDGEGQPSRVYGTMQDKAVDLSEGVINTTGRELDVAISGPGLMAVRAPDGSEAYTRRGDLRVTDLGQLLNGAGQQVMGDSGPIAVPPYSDIAIGGDGTVSIVALGEDPNSLTAVDRIKLVNPDSANVIKGVDGLLRMRDGVEPEADAVVNLISGSLESSNVNSVAAMVSMIELAREYESYIKLMSTAEKLDQSSTELMSLS